MRSTDCGIQNGMAAEKVCRGAKYAVLSTPYAIIAAALYILVASATAAPPKLNNFFPARCQRGQSVTVTASGDFSSWPVKVWADRPGVSRTEEKDKGKSKA